MSETLIPELRFEGFDEEWLPHPLANVASVSKGQGYSKSDLRERGVPIFLYGRLYTQLELAVTEVGTFTSTRPNSVFSKGGEVLIPASGETPEDIVRASALLKPGVILGGDLNVLGPFAGFDPVLLALRICTGDPRTALVRRAQGKSVVHLRGADLNSISLTIPEQDEQQEIGSLFTKLESLINQRRRKHTQLKQTKVALMQRMFPKEGADEPELRFEGFSEAWKRTTLGSVAKISSAARVHKSQWKSAGVPFYRASDVTAFKNGTVNPKAFISFDLYEKLTATSGRLQKGDLLVVGGGTVGVPYIVPTDEPLYSKDADLLWLKPLPSAVSEYLATYLTSQGFQRYLKSISHSGTIAHYTIVQAKGTALPLPSPAEQQAIGAFFTKLDVLITAEQSHIDKLRQVKSALLQKMFV
jgi:type I restriction enzyme S subunit